MIINYRKNDIQTWQRPYYKLSKIFQPSSSFLIKITDFTVRIRWSEPPLVWNRVKKSFEWFIGVQKHIEFYLPHCEIPHVTMLAQGHVWHQAMKKTKKEILLFNFTCLVTYEWKREARQSGWLTVAKITLNATISSRGSHEPLIYMDNVLCIAKYFESMFK